MSARSAIRVLTEALVLPESLDLGLSGNPALVPSQDNTNVLQLGSESRSLGFRIYLGAANQYVDFTTGAAAEMIVSNVTFTHGALTIPDASTITTVNATINDSITVNGTMAVNTLTTDGTDTITTATATDSTVTTAIAGTINTTDSDVTSITANGAVTTATATTLNVTDLTPTGPFQYNDITCESVDVRPVADDTGEVVVGNTTHGLDVLWIPAHATKEVRFNRGTGTVTLTGLPLVSDSAVTVNNAITTDNLLTTADAAATWAYQKDVTNVPAVTIVTRGATDDLAVRLNGLGSNSLQVGVSNQDPPFPFSVSFWFRTEGTSAYGLFWFGDRNTAFDWSSVYVWNDAVYMNEATTDNPGSASDEISVNAAPYSNGDWHHVVAIWEDATTRRLIVNGSDIATSNTTITHVDQYDRIAWGRRGDSSPSHNLLGALDHCMYFENKILSNAEAKWLFNRGRGRSQAELAVSHWDNPYPNTSSFWPMSENSPGGIGDDIVGPKDLVVTGTNTVPAQGADNDLLIGSSVKDGDVKAYAGNELVLSCDGSNYVRTEPIYNIDYPYTMIGWSKTTDAGLNIFMTIGNSNNLEYARLEHNVTTLRARLREASGTSAFPAKGGTHNDGAWHMTALICNSATSHNIIVDDTAVITNAVEIIINSGTDPYNIVSLGGRLAADGNNINGQCGGFLLLNTGLNANQISWFYNAGAGRSRQALLTNTDANSINYKNVIGDWPCNELDDNRKDYSHRIAHAYWVDSDPSTSYGVLSNSQSVYVELDRSAQQFNLRSVEMNTTVDLVCNGTINADRVVAPQLNVVTYNPTGPIEPVKAGYEAKKVIYVNSNTLILCTAAYKGALFSNKYAGGHVRLTLQDPDTATNGLNKFEIINEKGVEDRCVDNQSSYNICENASLPDVSISNGLTMITWMRGTDTSGFGMCLANATHTGTWCAVGTISGQMVAEVNTSLYGYDSCVSIENTYNNNTWHMVAGRFNATEQRVWVDGGHDVNTNVATQHDDPARPWTRVGTGGRLDSSPSQSYSDWIDGSVLFNTELTDSQLRYMYNNGKGRTPEALNTDTHPDNPGSANVVTYYRLSANHGDWKQDTYVGNHIQTNTQPTVDKPGVMDTSHLFGVDSMGIRGAIFVGANNEHMFTNTLPVVDYPFSAEVWFKTGTNALMYLFSCQNWTIPNVYWALRGTTSGFNLAVRDGATYSSRYYSSNEWHDDNWHHAVMVCNNSSHRELWFDNDLKDTNTSLVPKTNTWERYNVGVYELNTGITGTWDGEMWCQRVWRERLTNTHIEWLFNSGSGRTHRAIVDTVNANNPGGHNLKASWGFREASGTRFDLTTTGADLTDNNTTGAGAAAALSPTEMTQSNFVRPTDASDGAYDINTYGGHAEIREVVTRWLWMPYGGTTYQVIN